ncbi:unnamed protein product [Peniophora sp. CBMAI 1063]|nr:unnamed protein product [Peniophora sp. CBMAI 1063]
MATTKRVPSKVQAAQIGRASDLYINREDSQTRWNDVITQAGELPSLRSLHLSRQFFQQTPSSRLVVKAPNLEHLCVDCYATVSAPALRSIKFTNIPPNFPQLLKATLNSCSELEDVDIVAPECNSVMTWKGTYACLPDSKIQSLNLTFCGWNAFPRLSAIVLPHLARLTTNVPARIISSVLTDLSVEGEIQDVLVMLRGMLALETLHIGSRTFTKALREVTHLIVLPRCHTIHYRGLLDACLVKLLENVTVPRLSYLQLHSDMDALRNGGSYGAAIEGHGPSPGVGFEAHVRDLGKISSSLQTIASAPAHLSITCKRDSPASFTEFQFAVQDAFAKAQAKPGLCVSATTVEGAHDQPRSVFSHMLQLCAWGSIATVELSLLPPTPAAEGYLCTDPLHAEDEGNRALLAQNLMRMTGVQSLTVNLAKATSDQGLALLRSLSGLQGAWPRLERVCIRRPHEECTSLVHDSNSRSQWLDELHILVRRRQVVCFADNGETVEVTLQCQLFGKGIKS